MLGFLLPKLAWLSLIAAAPLIIHLLNRIRLRRVEFSSLRFLHQVRSERFNWLRLRELLLLIARTALLLFLLLGLSRPFLRQGLFGIKREVSAVLIIDDSYSMRYGDNWDRAIAAARGYLSRLAGRSEVALLTCAASPVPDLSRNLQQAGRVLDSLAPSCYGPTLLAAVEQARIILNHATLPQQEIVIFTDLQKRALAGIEVNPATRMPILLKDCGSANPRNCAMTTVLPRERLPQPGHPLTLSARVRSFSNGDEVRTLTLRSGAAVESRSVSVAPWAEQNVEFDHEFTAAGEHSGSVSLDPDSLPGDDQAFFALSVPSRIPVLVVGNAPEDTNYLARALAPDTNRLFRVATRLSANLRTADLRQFRAVALLDPVNLTAFDWQRLRDYVSQGGGLFVALSREPRDKTYLSEFVSFAGEGKPTGFMTMGNPDFTHPVFEAFMGRSDLSLARFFLYAKLEPTGARVLARFTDGAPCLLEARDARVVVLASGLRLADNDLMLRGFYVPLVHRIFSYLAQDRLTRSYTVGDTLTTPAPAVGLLSIATPDAEFSLVPAPGTRDVRFGGTDVPGIYRMGTDTFAVNLPFDESDLTRLPETDLARKGIAMLPEAGGRTSDLTGSFLLAAALCLIAEMVMLII